MYILNININCLYTAWFHSRLYFFTDELAIILILKDFQYQEI